MTVSGEEQEGAMLIFVSVHAADRLLGRSTFVEQLMEQ
jgi:hypothetical protein